jgi:hypothetical protein
MFKMLKNAAQFLPITLQLMFRAGAGLVEH